MVDDDRLFCCCGDDDACVCNGFPQNVQNLLDPEL